MKGYPRGSGRLVVDLGAIQANYRSIADHAGPIPCAAVVKANAYGLGVRRVAPALAAEGCRHFFVATLDEGLELREILGPDAGIFILNGAEPGGEADCAEAGLVPVLNSVGRIERWGQEATRRDARLPAALQIDSGMSRLGLCSEALSMLAAGPALRPLSLRLLISHLACADEAGNSANERQLERFADARRHFPDVPASLSNSGGAYLSPAFHLDMVRAGIALFGVAPGPHAPRLQPVVSLAARILQIREIRPGDGVGYGLEHVAHAPQRVATLGIGYADGWIRRLGGTGAAMHAGKRLPIIGRISMDSLVVDISDLPRDALAEDCFVELLGPLQSPADVARDAGTIGYELLAGLGARLARSYVDSAGCRP